MPLIANTFKAIVTWSNILCRFFSWVDKFLRELLFFIELNSNKPIYLVGTQSFFSYPISFTFAKLYHLSPGVCNHFSMMIILLIKISSFICRTDVFWNSRFCQHVCIFFVFYENAIPLKSLNHYAFASLELFGMAISALVLLRNGYVYDCTICWYHYYVRDYSWRFTLIFNYLFLIIFE